MKVLGLNFGRVNQQCDHYLQKTLAACAAAGAEVETVQMCTLDIGRCRGCGACSGGLKDGKFDFPMCIFKDDFQMVMEKIFDADSLVLAAPVYVLAPVGQYKDFVDRMGPACDRAVMEHRQAQRVRDGKNPIDPRLLKKKYISYLSIGGAREHHWVSLGLPTMNLFGMSLGAKVIGQVDIHGAYGSDARREMYEGFCEDLGGWVVKETGKEYGDIAWHGMEGVCPSCHGNEFMFENDTTTVTCPVCGITGELSFEDDQFKVTFTPEMLTHSRLAIDGPIPGCLEDHYVELHGDELEA